MKLHKAYKIVREGLLSAPLKFVGKKIIQKSPKLINHAERQLTKDMEKNIGLKIMHPSSGNWTSKDLIDRGTRIVDGPYKGVYDMDHNFGKIAVKNAIKHHIATNPEDAAKNAIKGIANKHKVALSTGVGVTGAGVVGKHVYDKKHNTPNNSTNSGVQSKLIYPDHLTDSDVTRIYNEIDELNKQRKRIEQLSLDHWIKTKNKDDDKKFAEELAKIDKQVTDKFNELGMTFQY